MDLSERGLHGALLDSRLLAEVYLELKGGKQFSMNLSKTPKTKINHIYKKQTSNKTIIRFKASEEDLNLQKKIVKEIKEPLWKKYNY